MEHLKGKVKFNSKFMIICCILLVSLPFFSSSITSSDETVTGDYLLPFTSEELKKILIPLPNIEIQKKMATEVKTRIEKIMKLQ